MSVDAKYRKLYSKLLDECTSDTCSKCGYCFIKELIIVTHKYDHRTIFQLKLIEIFKYLESERDKVDIGWDEALARWVRDGFAAKFADYYNPIQNPEQVEMSPVEVFEKVVNDVRDSNKQPKTK